MCNREEHAYCFSAAYVANETHEKTHIKVGENCLLEFSLRRPGVTTFIQHATGRLFHAGVTSEHEFFQLHQGAVLERMGERLC